VGSLFFLRSEVNAPRLDLADWIKPHAKHSTKQKSTSGFPPGSVGDISSQVGYDIRELLMAGFTRAEIASYSEDQIEGVIDGRLTLAELREQAATD
jgi:hypothetical protein